MVTEVSDVGVKMLAKRKFTTAGSEVTFSLSV
jgi:hypothetical protein